MDVDDCLARLSEENPGFDDLVFQITTLISTHPPPFIYINSPASPRVTSLVVSAVLSTLSDRPSTSNLRIRYAHANGVACFTPRLLYDSVLNSLANWKVNWDDGCRNWAADGEKPIWNENLDSFLHGLKAVHAELANSSLSGGKNKGKKPKVHVNRMVLLIERAERLKETMPDIIVPLTRLAELVSFFSSSR
jgi:origin recognition complex subunit 5